VTALVLAAVVSEQKRAEQRLQVQDAISRILAESPVLKEAASKIVQVLCERAGWEVGAVWNVDRAAHELVCVEVWHPPWIKAPNFEAITRQKRFAPGIGLPGRVWSSGKPAWIPDVTKDSNFPRAPVAIKEHLHAAFGFPIKLGDETLGVIECFSREIREPDDHFLQMVGSIGDQLGQFVERKRTQDALRDSEGRLQLALAAGRMGAWEWNISTNQVMWSASLEEIHGLQQGSFGGGFEDFKRDIHPADVQSVLGEIESTLQTRGDYHIAYRITHPTGEVRWLEAFGTLLLGASGQPEKLVGVCMDITDRKQAEAALRQATEDLARVNEELERRVQERTAQLERAHAALLRDMEEQKRLEEQLRQAQKMESIGTLAGGIAHDFNNILNIIRGYALLIGRHPAADEKIAESLKVIDEGIERGASVVRQLLTMARKTEANLALTNLNEVVSELSKLLKQTFPKTIEVVLELDSKLPPVMADSNQISQALLNLCLNARDAMPDGGKLLITTEIIPGAIMRGRFQEAREQGYASIKVTDTGLGMDEATKSRIFEPFFTTKQAGEGTGLGLSVVYGIITSHAGFVDASSEPGCGTRFAVYLPIPAEEEIPIHGQSPADKQASALHGNGETILFVDDEVRQLRLMQQFLENFGYKVLTAKDGAEAVELHARHKDEIAAVVLDLGLPKINGWEALKAMKKANPRLKPIVASGYLFSQQEPEPGEGSHVIMKPYLLDDVLAKIAEVIRHP
jgi:two-component system cell cycle sensor histidine kinase/response regulator CckA